MATGESQGSTGAGNINSSRQQDAPKRPQLLKSYLRLRIQPPNFIDRATGESNAITVTVQASAPMPKNTTSSLTPNANPREN